jgi:hypothetical protein
MRTIWFVVLCRSSRRQEERRHLPRAADYGQKMMNFSSLIPRWVWPQIHTAAKCTFERQNS